MHRRNSSLSGTDTLPLYLICPSSSVLSATAISCNPLLIRIASSILPGSRSVSYAIGICSEIAGWPWAGRLSANKHNCSGRFCGFRSTCSIFFNLGPCVQGGLLAFLSNHQPSRLIFLVCEQSSSQKRLKILTIMPAFDLKGFLS